MGANLRIGEILAERGYVNEQQMEEALAYQKGHRDRRVGQILIELQFVTEQQVLEALASRLDLEIVDVSLQTVDLEAFPHLKESLNSTRSAGVLLPGQNSLKDHWSPSPWFHC